MMVDQESEVEPAAQRIKEFGEGLGFKIMPVRGKVIEWLRRFNPPLYTKVSTAPWYGQE
jgi:hypothetical protein